MGTNGPGMTPEVQAALQAMQQEIQRLRDREATLSAQVTQLQGTGSAASAGLVTATSLKDMMEAQKELMNALKSKEQVRLVDNRGLGKPDRFDGDLEKFLPWRIKTTSYLCSIRKELREVLQWAEEKESPVTDKDVEDNYGSAADPIDQMSNIQELRRELHDVLLMVTEREPFDLVLNSTCGFEAWRRLSRRFDPTTGGRKRALLNSILSPNRTKLEELPQAMEKLLDSIRLYERRRDSTGARTTISEDIKISVIERLVPAELERHLVLNRDRYVSFNDILGEIQSYVEHQTGSKIKVFNSQGRVDPHSRPDDPMDVGFFGKGKKGKGKGGSKGGKPGDKKSETCFNCGKPGHRKADCWAPGGGKANSGPPKQGSFKGSGKKGSKSGNGQKGKGKGKKGKGKSKSVSNVEAENHEPEAEGWDASWEGYDEQEWQPEAEGEKNSLSIGALDEEDPDKDEKEEKDKKEEKERERRLKHAEEEHERRRRRRRKGSHRSPGAHRNPDRAGRDLMRRRSAPPPTRSTRLGSVERRLQNMASDSDDDWGNQWKGNAKGKGKGSKGSKGKGKEADDLLGSVIDVALEDADDHLETGHPTAMSAHPSREELERLQAENQKLQARMNEIQEQLRLALESTKPSVAPRDEKPKDKPLVTPKEMPKPATRPRARAAKMVQQRSRSREPAAVPRHPPPKPPSRVDAYDWSILPDDEWRSMRFRERVDYKTKLRGRVPRGSVGEQQIDAQGGDCTTCDERTPVVTRAAMAYADKRQVYPKAKAKESTYAGTYDADDGGEEIPSRSGVPKPAKAAPKKAKGTMKPPEPAKGPMPPPPKVAAKKGSMKPPEPKVPPKKEAAKKASAPTTTGTALVSTVRGVLSTQLLIASQETDDPEKIAKAKAMVADLRERPRRSVTITEENIGDQSFHDSRYYAALAKGMAHHLAWKEERLRRRAILHRRSGTAEPAKQRIELDQKRHEEFDRPESRGMRRIDDVDGLNADIPTEVIGKDDKPETSVTELTRSEKRKHQQFPDDEATTLERTKKAAEDKKPRVRNEGWKKRKNQGRNKARAKKRREEGRKGTPFPKAWNEGSHSDGEGEEEEDDNDDAPDEPRDKPGRGFDPSAGGTGATVAVHSFGADSTDAVRNGHWQKLEVNLDTGAAVTAIPLSLAQEYGLSEPPNETKYKTANGDELVDEGGVKLSAQDSHYNRLAIDGRVTDVHRVLLSGQSAAKTHHIALGPNGGALIPKGTEASREYDKFMKRLTQKYSKEMTPVKVRKGIYLVDCWVPFVRQPTA